MIPIKILCGCGAKYSFNVEPVRGELPWPVQCPNCGADGTAAANSVLAHAPDSACEPIIVRAVSLRLATPTELQATPPRKSRGKLVAGLITSALLVMVAVGAFAVWKINQPQVQSGLIADGLPRTYAELDQWYTSPPTNENAALVFEEAFAALQITPADNELGFQSQNRFNPPLDKPLSIASRKKLADLSNRNQIGLKLLKEATRLDQSRYSIDLKLGTNVALPHLAKAKQAAILATAYSIAQADANHPAEATEGIQVTLAVARSLRNEPAVISQLVRISCIALVIDALQQALNRTAFSAQELQQLANSFQTEANSFESGDGFNRALVAERVTLASAPASDLPFVQRAIQEAIEARKEPYPDRLKADLTVKQHTETGMQKAMPAAAAITSTLSTTSVKEAGAIGHLRLALTAIALERFRAANGRYPISLSELAPQYFDATPQNPFDGAPLNYWRGTTDYELSFRDHSNKPTVFRIVKATQSH